MLLALDQQTRYFLFDLFFIFSALLSLSIRVSADSGWSARGKNHHQKPQVCRNGSGMV